MRYCCLSGGGNTGGVFNPINLGLYTYTHNNPVKYVDPNGEETLADAKQYLIDNNIEKADKGLIWDFYSDTQIFDAWLILERKDTSWQDNIPKCPKAIEPENGFVPNGDRETWGDGAADVSGNSITQKFHPGASFEMRSQPNEEGCGNQCIYNAEGRIMKNIPAAGSADRSSPEGQVLGGYFSDDQHYSHDVEPFHVADDLDRVEDYYSVRPVITEGIQ